MYGLIAPGCLAATPSPGAIPISGPCRSGYLSRIIDRVEHGEEIIISRAGKPVAKVIPLIRRVNRTGRGSLRDRLVATEDWDSPEVNEAIAHDFGMGR